MVLEDRVRDYLDRIDRADDAALLSIAGVYEDAARRTIPHVERLHAEYTGALARGEAPSRFMFDRLDAHAQLLRFYEQQTARLSDTLGEQHGQYIQRLVGGHADVLDGLVADTLARRDDLAGWRRFHRAWAADLAAAAKKAADAAVGLGSGGSVVRAFQHLADTVIRDVDSVLVDGLLRGLDARRLAREVRASYGSGLADAVRFVRTEANRAARAASQRETARLGVMQWRRTAPKNGKTCIACLLADGTLYDRDDRHDFHVNCRCALIPQLPAALADGTPLTGQNPQLEGGRDWFLRQGDATQRRVLGSLYGPWKAGALDLDDMVHVHRHPVYGPARKAASLSLALSQAKVRQAEALAPSGPAARMQGAVDQLHRVFRDMGLDPAGDPGRRRALLRGGQAGLEDHLRAHNARTVAELARHRAALAAASKDYQDALDGFMDHQGAARRAYQWLRDRGIDADAGPGRAVQDLRRYLEQNPQSTPVRLVRGNTGPQTRAAHQNAATRWDAVNSQLPIRSPAVADALARGVAVKYTAGRAFASAERPEVHLRANEAAWVVVHELFHAAEWSNPELAARHAAWVLDRGAAHGTPDAVRLRAELPGHGYGPNERTILVPGVDRYATKIYRWPPTADYHDPRQWYATEVLSQWATHYLSGTWNGRNAWQSAEERDWFALGLAALAGL